MFYFYVLFYYTIILCIYTLLSDSLNPAPPYFPLPLQNPVITKALLRTTHRNCSCTRRHDGEGNVAFYPMDAVGVYKLLLGGPCHSYLANEIHSYATEEAKGIKNEGTELVTMVTTMLPVLGILLSLSAMDVLEHFWLTRININWELLDFVDTGDINHQILASLPVVEDDVTRY